MRADKRMGIRTRRIVSIASASVIAAIGVVTITLRTSQAKPAQAAQPKKLLIEVGWDAPTPDFVRAHITEMEKKPFAGTMINLHAGKTFLNKKAYPASSFVQDEKDLAAVTSTSFNQNFITMWSAREEGWDWFNNDDWSAALSNAKNFAKLANATPAVQGLMFDPEPYGTNPWSYDATLYPTKTFVSVQSKVRERGASFMKAVQKEKPNIKILMLFGAAIVSAQAEERKSLEKAEWALYASFINGMLDVIGPRVELIEGNEGAYYYQSAKDFDWFASNKKAAGEMVSPENRAKFDRQVRVGSSVFVDGTLNLLNSPRFFGFYLADETQRQQFLQFTTYHALRTSNQYVWVYNEQMDWWGSKGSGVSLPANLETSLRNAKDAALNNRALPFSVEPFVTKAQGLFNARVEIDGRVSSKGVGLGGVFLSTEFQKDGRDYACEVTKPDGYFQCFVPSKWKGRITPSKDGYSFERPFFEGNGITEPMYDLAFEATKTG
jgi:hypothetical protein